MPIATRGYPFTAVDASNLFDKVILHELTHTNAGGNTVDVRQHIVWSDAGKTIY